ncbi:MAG: ABC transporter ATP-binding protein, partial [Deltaproteobacteria bacterium]
DIILNIVDLNKSFPLHSGIRDLIRFKRSKNIKVVDNISFKIPRGEILVVAGESGSGKTTIAKLIMRAINPDSGSIFFDNIDITKLKGKQLLNTRSKVQMIFQDPYSSLDPRMKIFDIIKEPLDVHKKGLRKQDIKEYVFSALEKVNLDPDEVSSKFPHMLSGGQRQRVSFARALVLKPLLIIADEPVSMLDVSIRGQILELMKKLKQEENVSFLYITHDLATSQYIGDNIIILYKGQIIEQGDIKQVLHHPLHPYTRALISAIPKFANINQLQPHQEIKLKNDLESAASNQGGCKFINKCLYSTDKCKNSEPLLTKEEIHNPHDPHNSHFIRCFNYESIS